MPARVLLGLAALALIVAAFSLRPAAAPLGAPTVGPDAFRIADAGRLLDELADRFPDRRAGSLGDGQLAAVVQRALQRTSRGMAVRRSVRTADTPDGRRPLVTVEGTLPGPPGPEIVVVAHRDAVRRPARSELSATVGLIGLASAMARSRPRHTMRFVSVSGSSGGGLAGMDDLAERLEPARTRAVVVVGDLAAARPTGGLVVPWSNDTSGMAPRTLVRTAVDALRREGLPAREPRLGSQVVRQGLPATIGGQGVFLPRGIPAVSITSTSRPPRPDAPTSVRNLGAFGRGALRLVQAVDVAERPLGPPRVRLSLLGRELPLWVVRMLLALALLPALALLVLASRGLRAGHPVTGLARPVSDALVPLGMGLAALGLAATGVLGDAAPAPVGGPALHPGWGGWAIVALLALVGVAVAVLVRPVVRVLLAGPTGGRTDPESTAWGVAAILLVLGAVLLVVDPLSALLVVPAGILWPLVLAPEASLPRGVRLAALVGGALAPVAAMVTLVVSLDVAVTQIPWWLTLLMAGGQVQGLALVATCLVLGCGVATAATWLQGHRDETEPGPLLTGWHGVRARREARRPSRRRARGGESRHHEGMTAGAVAPELDDEAADGRTREGGSGRRGVPDGGAGGGLPRRGAPPTTEGDADRRPEGAPAAAHGRPAEAADAEDDWGWEAAPPRPRRGARR